MTRTIRPLLPWLALALAAGLACGRYGPPIRAAEYRDDGGTPEAAARREGAMAEDQLGATPIEREEADEEFDEGAP